MHVAKLGARASPDLRNLVYRYESAYLRTLDKGHDGLGSPIPSHD